MTKRIAGKLGGSKPDNPLAGLDTRSMAECRECICFNLRKATRVVTQLYDDRMRPMGIRATQFALLVHIQAMGPVSLTKLAEAMVTDRTTMARNLEPLETSGLIKVDDGKDRRSRIISITDEGIGKLIVAYPVWKKTQGEVKKLVGGDEWSEIMSMVSIMVDRLREK